MRYIINWSCEECGKGGKIVGEDHYDAHKTFDLLKAEHEKHSNVFMKDEGYVDEVQE